MLITIVISLLADLVKTMGLSTGKGNTILQFELLDLIPTLTVSFKTLLLISL